MKLIKSDRYTQYRLVIDLEEKGIDYAQILESFLITMSADEACEQLVHLYDNWDMDLPSELTIEDEEDEEEDE